VTSRTGDSTYGCGDLWLRVETEQLNDLLVEARPIFGLQLPDLRGCSRRAVLLALSLMPTHEDRFGDGGLASLSLDVRAGRIGLCPKVVGREGEQPEVVVMRPMAMGRTRAAIACSPEIVDRLLDILVPRGTVRKFRNGRRKVVSRPMVPRAGRCIGIVAEQDKTPRSGRWVRPLQRWREVFSVAGEAPRNCCSVGEGA
jgi:hypothetical protein